jgi:YXWGXW repeat-containing protein
MEDNGMRRALLAAGAIVVLAAPAFAQSSSVTVEKRTWTETKTVPEVGSTVSTVVIAPKPPPAPRVEAPPPPPPGEAWVPGHWAWNSGTVAYVWTPGHFARPPRVHAAWMPGHWAQRPNGWVWVEGHWN